jgi:hypothetical protein
MRIIKKIIGTAVGHHDNIVFLASHLVLGSIRSSDVMSSSIIGSSASGTIKY